MTTRAAQLALQLTEISEAIALWKATIARLRADADIALAIRAPRGAILQGVSETAEAIAAEIDRYYSLLHSSIDLPGVRDGQINGVSTMLENLAAACDQLALELRRPQFHIAA